MSRTHEPVGMWIRVSSGGQDETNQIPDIKRYCAEHGYTIAKEYQLNDKSASKGEQQETLDRMVHDIRTGTITVLVCWHSDRLERRGAEYVFRLLSQVRDANGRIESTQEPLFGGQDLAGQASTAINAAISNEKSAHLRQQVKLAWNRISANGGVGPGGTPWGYRIVGPKYNKRLEATDICREYAPQIFDRVIAGESYSAIAAWLDSEGVAPQRGGSWSEGSIRKLIRNRVYAGRWQNAEKTKTVTRTEAVVKANRWDAANEAIKRQPNRRPAERSLLVNLKCGRCADSPMHRIGIKDRHGRFTYYYYRCAGRGARRHGCGNMIRCEDLERWVRLWILVTKDEPHFEQRWIEGTNWDSEISNVKQDLREAIEAEDFDKLPELQAQLEDFRSREVIPGHWHDEPTDLTKGQYFASLDPDGKRDYLRSRDVRAVKAGKSRHEFKVWIDGEECDRDRLNAADLAYAAKTGLMPSLWPDSEPFPVP